MAFETDKLKFLNMPPEEKRAFITKKVTTLDEIKTWTDYWKERKSEIKVRTEEKVERVNSELADKVSLWMGDITVLEVDAIVNAANKTLLGGGGGGSWLNYFAVDGAIHKAAGKSLKDECASLEGCQIGAAKITGGYMLPAKYVIHTVGPHGEKPDKLRECYQNSLVLAKEYKLRSIAFPCIATGIYGYPQRAAAKVALATVKKFLVENKDSVDRVIFCLFLEADQAIYEELLQKFFGLE